MNKGVKSFDRQTDDRIEFIDVARGIGILLVVFGHLISEKTPLYTVIYSFHMPFFFFLSGVFAKPEITFKQYLQKNSKKLLVPFVVVFFVGIIYTGVMSGFSSINLFDVFKQFVFARPIGLNVGPIWFLACLFDVTLIFFVLYKLILSKENPIITIFVLGGILIFAYFLPLIENKFNLFLPFKLDVAFMATIFYTLGFLLRGSILKGIGSEKWYHKIIIIVFSVFVIALIPYFVIGQTFLSGGIYGKNIFLYIFTAFCGSILIILLGIILKKSRFLSYIGRNSLIIFSLHTLLIPFYYKLLEHFGMKANIITSLSGTIIILVIMMIISYFKDVLIKKYRSIS